MDIIPPARRDWRTVLGLTPDVRLMRAGLVPQPVGALRWSYEHRSAVLRRQADRVTEAHVAALREALGALLGLAPREVQITVPRDYGTPGAVVALALPDGWLGTTDQRAAVTALIGRRLRGSWSASWSQDQTPATVRFSRIVERPKPPRLVEWEPSDDPFRIFVGRTGEGPKYVHTQTQTPHFGVSGNTGSGKTCGLLIPITHGRMHGQLVDIIDLKEDSYEKSVMGVSGVRVHTTAVEAVAAMAEFFTSLKAIRTAREQGYPVDTIPARLLVIDEFGSFMLAARSWWKYGLRGKGTAPFEGLFHMILMQGRTKNHRIVVGAHQFSVEMFKSTDARDLVGTKIVIGPCSPPKWVVTFGNSAKRFTYDGSIPGRGVIGITGQDDRIEELQVAYLREDDARALCMESAPAPEWFDRREIAPWISEEAIELADQEGSVRAFLPGIGEYVTRSQATGPGSSDQAEPAVRLVDVSWKPPRRYSLREAAEERIVPYSYANLRRYRSQDKAFPEGDIDGTAGNTRTYSPEELREWHDNRVNSKGA